VSLVIKNNDIYMDGKRVARIFAIDEQSMIKLKQNLNHSPAYELLREIRAAVYNESQRRKLGTVLTACLSKTTEFLLRN
tara:strand:+ start:29546 stop:29782 length:237 start_codon:yes stop_codon:yes gene_type:complete